LKGKFALGQSFGKVPKGHEERVQMDYALVGGRAASYLSERGGKRA
jgi:hypothetical protein